MLTLLLIIVAFMLVSGLILTRLEVKREMKRRRDRLSQRARGIKRR